MTPNIDKMSHTLVTRFQSIFETILKHYGNPLHIAVYIRDINLFKYYETKEYLNEKFDGYTPVELASKLGYNEFINGELLNIDPVSGERVIKQGLVRKYINPFRGYKERLIKITKDHLMTFSDKVTVYELDAVFVVRDKNTLYVKSKKKKVRLKCEVDCDQWYELLINKQKRYMLANVESREVYGLKELNPYIYIFLLKVLVEKSEDEELKGLIMNMEPFKKYFAVAGNKEADDEKFNEADCESSETYYDSCNEEFYDVASR